MVDTDNAGKRPQVAVLGTGIMGSAIARNLIAANLRTTVWDRSPSATSPLSDAGARVARSVDEAVHGAPIVITMLPTADVVSAVMFDGEVIGDAFLIDVTEQDRAQLRAARPADEPVVLPAGKSWPVFMTFTRGRQQDQRPLFTVSALVFNNGVLDRLTVETGLLSVTADLQALEMRPAPVCPRS